LSTTTDTTAFLAESLFTCPNHPGNLKLTPAACAASWHRARRNAEADQIRLAPCINCPVGAGHAGVRIRPAAPVQQPASTGLSCVRCGRGGRRLIGGLRCVSCDNREREYRNGKNAKGGPPSQYRPLFGCVIGAITDAGAVRPLAVDWIASPIEALLTVARATGSVHFGRVPPGAPATPCPAMPKRQAVFALAKPPA
jgi:hypothetical protein